MINVNIDIDWLYIEIRFETSYCNLHNREPDLCVLSINKQDNILKTKLVTSWLYSHWEVDREEYLSNCDFVFDSKLEYECFLPNVWVKEIEYLLNNRTLSTQNKISEDDFYIQVNVKCKKDIIFKLYSNNNEKWSTFLDEIIPAIYERSGSCHGKINHLQFYEINDKFKLLLYCKVSYVYRNAIVKVNNIREITLDWEWTKKLMYIFKYFPRSSEWSFITPELNGKYFYIFEEDLKSDYKFEEGYWCEIDNSFIDLDYNCDVNLEIEQLLNQIDTKLSE